MKLFDIIPGNFFGLMTRSNKEIYGESLVILMDLFRKSKIFIDKDELFGELSSRLKEQVYEMKEEEGEDIGEQYSARIYYIIRKLEEFGWIERDDAFNQKKYVIPGYALLVIEAIDGIVNIKTRHYNSLVFGSFSALLTADSQNENHYEALVMAHKNTVELQNNLKSLLMNMKQYHKMLMRQTETRTILEHHFDSYAETIDIGQIHPLKTIDSIPRFKDKIIGIVEKWEADEDLFALLIKESKAVNGGSEEAASESIMRMMNEINDIYIGIDEITQEIDLKHKDYIRASQERIKTLIQADRSVKGFLATILNRLPKLRSGNSRNKEFEELLGEGLPLSSAAAINETSLFTQRNKKERGKEAPIKVESASAREKAEKMATELLVAAKYERTLLDSNDFVKEILAGKASISTDELKIKSRDAFLKLLFAIVNAHTPDAQYEFEFYDRVVWAGNVKIQEFTVALKNNKQQTGSGKDEVA